ncbi:MAG: CRISPR-associated endonuclease Cas2 [Syntrophothermus sp.]
MMTLVIYDVPDDKIRNRLAVACKDYGLQRVQWSAFLGFLNHNRLEELQRRLKRTLGRRMGNIQIYPLCDKDLRLRLEIEGLGGYRAPWQGERAGDPYAGDGDEMDGAGAKRAVSKRRKGGYLFVGEEPEEDLAKEPAEELEEKSKEELESKPRRQKPGGNGKAAKAAHTIAHTARKARSAT